MRHDTIQKGLTYFFAPADLEEEIYGCKSFHAFTALALFTPERGRCISNCSNNIVQNVTDINIPPVVVLSIEMNSSFFCSTISKPSTFSCLKNGMQYVILSLTARSHSCCVEKCFSGCV